VSALDVLLRKFNEDELFRRLAIGSPTFSEMVAEAIMKDRSGQDYRLAKHNAASIDLEAANGQHVQVKTVGTLGSFAGIKRGRDAAQQVMVITTFGEKARFFLVPMERFKALARTYDYPEYFSWEINGYRISSGVLNEFEIEVSLGAFDGGGNDIVAEKARRREHLHQKDGRRHHHRRGSSDGQPE
jgi:hypothetical protein